MTLQGFMVFLAVVAAGSICGLIIVAAYRFGRVKIRRGNGRRKDDEFRRVVRVNRLAPRRKREKEERLTE